MIKVTLLLGSLLVLTTATAVINPHDRNIVEGCKSETELWGSDDGTKYYFCIGNNQAYEQSCEPNTFFVKNSTVSGCIPVDQVSDNCIYHYELQPCQGEALKQPQPSVEPTKFYVCPEAGAQPLELNCPPEKAFVKQNGYLGCFAWSVWRKIRDCQ